MSSHNNELSHRFGLALASIFLLAGTAFAQTTSFTYQGQVESLLGANAEVKARLRFVEHALKQKKHLMRSSR